MYRYVPLFSLQGLNGKREGGVLFAIVTGIKNFKKKKSSCSFQCIFPRKKKTTQKTCIYIYIYSGSILSTINKAEYFSYDFWAVMGT